MPILELKPTRTCDEQGHIASDPNRVVDEQDIIRRIGQVITVGQEMVKIIQGLPALNSEEK